MSHRTLTPAKYTQQHDSPAAPAEAPEHVNIRRTSLARSVILAAALNPSPEVPEADGPDDTTAITVPLDNGSAHIEHFPDGHTELVVRLGHIVAAALILSGPEAQAVGLALARPHGPTVGDLWGASDALGGRTR